MGVQLVILGVLLGVVLNKADLNLLCRYEGHRGHYYDRRYYARYGYVD